MGATGFDDLVTEHGGSATLVERPRLAAAVEHSVACSALTVLTGDVGTGKTTLLAALARAHPDWLRYFAHRHDPAADPVDLLLSAGRQLARTRPALFDPESLPPEADRAYLDPRNLAPETLLELALREPATRLAAADPNALIVILIDATDTRATSAGLTDWLARATDLPRNVRLVLTARPHAVPRLRSARRDLTEVVIPAGTREARDETTAYAQSTLPALPHGSPALAQRVAENAGGNFLFVAAYAHALASHPDPKALAARRVPTDLPALYALLLEATRTCPRPAGDRIPADTVMRAVLGLLTVARAPLSAPDLLRLSGLPAGIGAVHNVLRQLRPLLREQDGRFALFHESVGEFLCAPQTHAAHPDRAVDPVEWHRHLARTCLRDDTDWSKAGEYELTHLTDHLTAAGQAHRLTTLVRPELRRALRARYGHDLWFARIVDLALATALANPPTTPGTLPSALHKPPVRDRPAPGLAELPARDTPAKLPPHDQPTTAPDKLPTPRTPTTTPAKLPTHDQPSTAPDEQATSDKPAADPDKKGAELATALPQILFLSVVRGELARAAGACHSPEVLGLAARLGRVEQAWGHAWAMPPSARRITALAEVVRHTDRDDLVELLVEQATAVGAFREAAVSLARHDLPRALELWHRACPDSAPDAVYQAVGDPAFFARMTTGRTQACLDAAERSATNSTAESNATANDNVADNSASDNSFRDNNAADNGTAAVNGDATVDSAGDNAVSYGAGADRSVLLLHAQSGLELLDARDRVVALARLARLDRAGAGRYLTALRRDAVLLDAERNRPDARALAEAAALLAGIDDALATTLLGRCVRAEPERARALIRLGRPGDARLLLTVRLAESPGPEERLRIAEALDPIDPLQAAAVVDEVAREVTAGQRGSAVLAALVTVLAARDPERAAAFARQAQGEERAALLAGLGHRHLDEGRTALAEALLGELLVWAAHRQPLRDPEPGLPFGVPEGKRSGTHQSSLREVRTRWAGRLRRRLYTDPAEVVRALAPGPSSPGSPYSLARTLRVYAAELAGQEATPAGQRATPATATPAKPAGQQATPAGQQATPTRPATQEATPSTATPAERTPHRTIAAELAAAIEDRGEAAIAQAALVGAAIRDRDLDGEAFAWRRLRNLIVRMPRDRWVAGAAELDRSHLAYLRPDYRAQFETAIGVLPYQPDLGSALLTDLPALSMVFQLAFGCDASTRYTEQRLAGRRPDPAAAQVHESLRRQPPGALPDPVLGAVVTATVSANEQMLGGAALTVEDPVYRLYAQATARARRARLTGTHGEALHAGSLDAQRLPAYARIVSRNAGSPVVAALADQVMSAASGRCDDEALLILAEAGYGNPHALLTGSQKAGPHGVADDLLPELSVLLFRHDPGGALRLLSDAAFRRWPRAAAILEFAAAELLTVAGPRIAHDLHAAIVRAVDCCAPTDDDRPAVIDGTSRTIWNGRPPSAA